MNQAAASQMFGTTPHLSAVVSKIGEAWGLALAIIKKFPSASASAPPRAIVIGENMERVRAAAKVLGADVYGPTMILPRYPTAAQLSDSYVEHGKWLVGKLDEGCVVYDVGYDWGRTELKPWYELERHILRKYKKRVPVSWPSSPIPHTGTHGPGVMPSEAMPAGSGHFHR